MKRNKYLDDVRERMRSGDPVSARDALLAIDYQWSINREMEITNRRFWWMRALAWVKEKAKGATPMNECRDVFEKWNEGHPDNKREVLVSVKWLETPCVAWWSGHHWVADSTYLDGRGVHSNLGKDEVEGWMELPKPLWIQERDKEKSYEA